MIKTIDVNKEPVKVCQLYSHLWRTCKFVNVLNVNASFAIVFSVKSSSVRVCQYTKCYMCVSDLPATQH